MEKYKPCSKAPTRMELIRGWGSITNHNMGIMRSTIIFPNCTNYTNLGYSPFSERPTYVASLDNPISSPLWNTPNKFCPEKHMSIHPLPIGSMYGLYANIWGIWMVNVTMDFFFLAKGIGLIGLMIFKHTALLTFVCRTSTWTAWTGPHAAGLVKRPPDFGLWGSDD